MMTTARLPTRFVIAIAIAFSALAGTHAAAMPDGAEAAAAVLFQDDFQDGDYTNTGGANGLTWAVVAGGARVEDVGGSFQLGVNRGASLIVSNQRIGGDDYTLSFTGRLTWSGPGRAVVLYKDANNYYSVSIGEGSGIYRRLNGVETLLHTDPEDLVRLPHGSAETGTFKIYARNTGGAIEIKADRAGDGVDYDIQIVDTNPTAVATFHNTGIGLLSPGGQADTPWFYVDGVTITSGQVVDTYTPRTYVVDRGHAQASDSNPGSEALPWRTIQHAADVVLAGDTVIVKAGTYNERITFASGTRGAPGQRITFRAEPRRSVTMWGFYTRFAHYLRVEGFNITTDPSLTGWTEGDGVFIDSDHVEVVDNHLYNIEGTGIAGTSVGATIADNRIYHSQMGIVISGSGWLVERNEVERLFGYGNGDSDYARFFGDDHVIRGNFFHGTDFDEIGDAHVDCFQIFDNNGEYAHRVVVDGNVCYDFHQGFMGEASFHHNISDLTFSNNIFAHGWAWGLSVHQITNVIVIHNVFADIQYHGAGFRDGATGVVRNNIFYNAGSNYWAADGGTVTGSDNLLFATTGTIDPADFPADRVNVNPLLANPGADDYHLLAGSPAIDAGLYVGTDTDLEGTIRPQGAGYDLGAYEVKPALVVHAAPSAQAVHLTWAVNVTLPVTTTWTLTYIGPAGSQPSPITGIPGGTRAFDLTGLTNYTFYSITLTSDPPAVAATAQAMPTDHLLYLPRVMK